MPNIKNHCCTAALLSALLIFSTPLAAQEVAGCAFAQATDGPVRQLFTCGSALSFEREPSAALRIKKGSNAPAPRTIEVEGGAILIDVSPGSAAPRIRTPHAVATVRGTTYVVDAQSERTSVFVIKGKVEVRSLGNSSTVTLREGDGVDVSAGAAMEVKSWGAGRVSALLARFGR